MAGARPVSVTLNRALKDSFSPKPTLERRRFMQKIRSGLPFLALALVAVSGRAETWAADSAENSGALPQFEANEQWVPVANDGTPMTPVEPQVEPGGYHPLTGKERWNLYTRQAFWSPAVLIRAAGPALGAHLSDEPPEWGQGAAGYSRRLANRFGRFALRETYEAAGAALLQHEVRYLRSTRSGFLPRAAHALTAEFVTYNRHGRRAPHISSIGSAFAAEFTGRLWMPDGYRDTSRAMRGVALKLGLGSAFNLIREFSPELKRILPGK